MYNLWTEGGLISIKKHKSDYLSKKIDKKIGLHDQQSLVADFYPG